MKAALRRSYGPPSTLRIEELPRPVPQRGQVLVRVRSVSLNASDVEAMTGRPLYARTFGLFFPRDPVLGTDLTGVVEECGAGTARFTVGDEVMGDILGAGGALSEWCAVPEALLMPKDPSLSFDEAASFPQAGAIAHQGLSEVKSGQRVLINGAGGGSGSWGIQLAKLRGAHVTAVDHGRKAAFMRELGADAVVDYTVHDFADGDTPFDWIVDAVGTRPLARIRRILAPGGRYRVVGGAVSRMLEAGLLGWTAGSGRSIGVLLLKPNEGVQEMVASFVAGQLKSIVQSVVPLEEAPEALTALAEGAILGKVVVRVTK